MNKLPPLSLYIHFPWCKKKCPYCDFNSYVFNSTNNITKDAASIQNLYIDQLIKDFEIDLKYVANREIQSIFLGGGTPNLFPTKLIGKLLNKINKHTHFNKNIEITLEANPGISDHCFKEYKEIGINRISIGAQSFFESKLKLIKRIHSSKDIIYMLESIKKANFNNFNIDIMYGLPTQSVKEAIEDLQCAIKHDPTHISWYHLTIEPNTAFYKKPPSKLPSSNSIENITTKGKLLLNKAGYKQYEVSAFSKKEYLCKHNLNYWQYGDYIGIGAGAHSKITTNNKIIRYSKVKYPKEYLTKKLCFLDEKKILNDRDLMFEFMLNNLRLEDGFNTELFTERTGLSSSILDNKLQKALDKKLVISLNDKIMPTTLGKTYLNDLCEIFLPN